MNEFGEDRKQIWYEYIEKGGQPHRVVEHMFTNYSRYFEAKAIAQWFIEQGIKMDFPILDYGCGVGDYGITLLRQGCPDVSFYDFPRAIKFVRHRLKRERLKGKAIDADKTPVNLADYNFIIFGEVLEHLDNPYEVLVESINAKYIFTSSYPYRSDDPEDPYWNNHDHDHAALEQQPACRELLESNFDHIRFDGELRLWFKP